MVVCRHGSGEIVKPRLFEQVDIESRIHGVLHHANQSHLASVVGRVDAGYLVLVQMLYLIRQDGPASATEQEDMSEACLVENLLGVGEHLHRTALVGGDCHRMGILLDGGAGHLIGPSVVP